MKWFWAAALIVPPLGFAGWWVLRPAVSQPGVDLARPIGEYPHVRYTAPEDWSVVVDLASPPGSAWVRLPVEQPVSGTVSNSPDVEHLDSRTCGECHSPRFEEFSRTAHFRTSQLPSSKSVLGSFQTGRNRVETRTPGFAFEMTERAGRFCVQLVCRAEGREFRHAERIDLVTGSGNHGQSYLYWQGEALYELPVSYFTEADRWMNSPGMYLDGTADFARPITTRCLDCHATWFEHVRGSVNRYARRNYVLGVGCVRCHGPGREHIQHHRSRPGDLKAAFIVNPASLERDRLNEICAQCHSGVGRLLQPAFSYQPGQPLADYVLLDMSADAPVADDPHSANQLLRLMKSACYLKHDSLSCTSCHDVHRHERGNPRLFSQRCIACHDPQACGPVKNAGPPLEQRCVDCHMPSQRNTEVVFDLAEATAMPLVRDHYIRILPDLSRRVLASLRIPETVLEGSAP